MQDFEAPTPKQPQHDFTKNPLYGKQPISYNAGSLEAVSAKMYFEGRVKPDELLCSFKYYDPEKKEKVTLQNFTAYLIGVYYGAFSNGKEKGEVNYQSNLVADTRTDILQSFYFIRPAGSDNYEKRVVATGNYKEDIAPALLKEGRKNAYTKVLVCYFPELDEVREIRLNATSEAGFVKAIAAASGTPEHKASLWGLTDITTEIWGFRFTGEFEPVVFSPKEAKNVPATVPAKAGAQKIYFQPVIKAGVIRYNNEKWQDIFNRVSDLQSEFADYIESEQQYYRNFLNKKTGEAEHAPFAPVRKVETATADANFPTADVTAYPEDDLPF